MSTEYTGSDHAQAIEIARLAYVGAIRDNRPDVEIATLRMALKRAVNEATIDADRRLAECAPQDPRVLFDVVTARDVVNILIVSSRATMIAFFAIRGLALDSTTIEELAHELAKNSAQGLLGLEIAP